MGSAPKSYIKTYLKRNKKEIKSMKLHPLGGTTHSRNKLSRFIEYKGKIFTTKQAIFSPR